MNFFKKLTLLALFGVTAGVSAQNFEQDAAKALHVLGKALNVELTRIDQQLSQENIDYAQAYQVIQQELPTIKAKFVQAFKRDLTKQEKKFVVNALRSARNVSVFTTDDLMLMAQGCSTHADRAAIQNALKQRYSELALNIRNALHTSPQAVEAAAKELEKIDLGNPSQNMFIRFMCKPVYFELYAKALLRADLVDDVQGLALQRACDRFANAIALPLLMLNDSYFFAGWQDTFKKSGDVFAITNMVCTQLLEAIEQA